jgi:replication factor A1|tara:strand:+ start:2502 stop:3020 length:519 start_codon:yes stop_codon:yes gene_type:complete
LKVDELTPRTGRVNMPVKVMSLDEPRSMDNGTMVCEGLVGDETGTVIMSFWNDEIETAQTDVVLDLKDARANLVRGHMRLSLGKKGSMKESDIVLDNIKQSVNLSDLEYEMPRMGGRGGPGRGGPRGGGRKPLGRWGDLMQLKRETGNKKFFNRDEMTEDQIIAAIKEMGGE